MKDMEEKKEKSKVKKPYLYRRIRNSEKRTENKVYELAILLRSDVSFQDAHSFFAKFKEKVEEHNFKTNKISYAGLRNLRYKIKKSKKAHFYFTHLQCTSDLCDEINRIFKINGSVLRSAFLSISNIPKDELPLVSNLEKDIKDGIVVYDERYSIKTN